MKQEFTFGNEKIFCSYLYGRFIPDSGSDPDSGIPVRISSDKFSGTEPEIQKIRYSGAGYPAQPYIWVLLTSLKVSFELQGTLLCGNEYKLTHQITRHCLFKSRCHFEELWYSPASWIEKFVQAHYALPYVLYTICRLPVLSNL